MNSATNIPTDTIYHCRTQLELSTFSYTWSIANFWPTWTLVSELYSDEIKMFTICFKLHVLLEEHKLKFYALMNENAISRGLDKPIAVLYHVSFLNHTNIMSKRATNLPGIKNRELLYELSISELKSNSREYLCNETLIICFKFNKIGNLSNSNMCYSQKIFMTNKPSFVPNKKSDSLVTFVINKKHLQASKALLCSKSKVFEAMFNSGLNESINNKVEIIDIKYDILKELLIFLQSGYLSKFVMADVVTIFELFIAAEKYDIKDLKSICEQCLIRNTTIENVVEHLKIAHLNNGTNLKKYALDFIKLHLKDIMGASNFITLMQQYQELSIQIGNTQLPITDTKYSTVGKKAPACINTTGTRINSGTCPYYISPLAYTTCPTCGNSI